MKFSKSIKTGNLKTHCLLYHCPHWSPLWSREELIKEFFRCTTKCLSSESLIWNKRQENKCVCDGVGFNYSNSHCVYQPENTTGTYFYSPALSGARRCFNKDKKQRLQHLSRWSKRSDWNRSYLCGETCPHNFLLCEFQIKCLLQDWENRWYHICNFMCVCMYVLLLLCIIIMYVCMLACIYIYKYLWTFLLWRSNLIHKKKQLLIIIDS